MIKKISTIVLIPPSREDKNNSIYTDVVGHIKKEDNNGNI